MSNLLHKYLVEDRNFIVKPYFDCQRTRYFNIIKENYRYQLQAVTC